MRGRMCVERLRQYPTSQHITCKHIIRSYLLNFSSSELPVCKTFCFPPELEPFHAPLPALTSVLSSFIRHATVPSTKHTRPGHRQSLIHFVELLMLTNVQNRVWAHVESYLTPQSFDLDPRDPCSRLSCTSTPSTTTLLAPRNLGYTLPLRLHSMNSNGHLRKPSIRVAAYQAFSDYTTRLTVGHFDGVYSAFHSSSD